MLNQTNEGTGGPAIMSKEPGVGNNGHKPTVLVVDDDPDLRMLAGMQLSDGYHVISCGGGRDAVTFALEHDPDVILLDLMMPDMSGSDVLRALSLEPRTKDIPVIFLSALGKVEECVAALERGATDFITKPADPRELKARVGVAARTHLKEEELRHSIEDPTTGLPDRTRFERRLMEEVSRSKRSRTPFSVLLIDIDQMDEANQRHGTAEGDSILRQIADAIVHTVRASDVPFRYGGDEFSVFLPDSDIATAYRAAERIRDAVRGITVAGRAASVSIGVAEYMGSNTAEELIAKAEIALFRAKESGGDQSWRADDPRRKSLSTVSLSEDLTQREWDVLSHLAQRLTEQEIASKLGISAGTVRSHKGRIRRKLHVPPDLRLTDYVKTNFSDLVHRLDRVPSSPPGTSS